MQPCDFADKWNDLFGSLRPAQRGKGPGVRGILYRTA